MKKFTAHLGRFFLFTTLFMLFAINLIAQVTSVQSGPASDPATWGGTAPTVFGGTGTGNITVASGHSVTFEANFTILDGTTFTVSTNAELLSTNGTFDITIGQGASGLLDIEGLVICGNLSMSNKADLTVNGTLIALSVVESANSGTQTIIGGTGTIYAEAITSTQVLAYTSITQTVGLNSWQGTSNTDYNTASNWSLGIVPTGLGSTSFIYSNGTNNQPTISSPNSVETLIIGNDATLTIAPTGDLEATVETQNEGTLLIQSDASGTGNLLVNTYTGNGIVNVERFLGAGNWYILSSPVTAVGMQDFAIAHAVSKTGFYALGPYDEASDSWAYMTNTETPDFAAGTGYTMYSTGSQTATFSGSMINTGTVSVSVDSSLYGWNSLGNPYTTSIDIATFLSENSAGISAAYGAVYIWNGSDYENPITGELSVGQGFVVKASASGSMLFNSTQQVTSPSAVFKSATVPLPELLLNVKSGELTNTVKINFSDASSDGLDKFMDIGKLKGNSNIALYTQLLDGSSAIDFAVLSLRNETFDTQSIPVGLDFPGGGEISFSLQSENIPEGTRVYLQDSKTGSKVQLNIENADYKLNLEPTSGYGRFNLVVENYTKSGEVATNIENENQIKNEVRVFARNKQIIISGQLDADADLSVYSIDGRMWHQGTVRSLTYNSLNAETYPNGIYVVRIEQAGKVQAHKIVLTK